MNKLHFQRPKAITETIDCVFERIAKKPESAWTLNGDKERYHLMKIDEHVLIKHIIDSDPKQTDYWFVELGAGVFCWVDSLARFLNQHYVDSAKTFHIVGVSGEGATIGLTTHGKIYAPKMVTEKRGRCQLHKIGGFRLEELACQLESLGLVGLQNKISQKAKKAR